MITKKAAKGLFWGLGSHLEQLNWQQFIDSLVFQNEDNIFSEDKKLYFRDAGLYIYSSTDGQLDIVADTTLAIAAPTTTWTMPAAGTITIDAGTTDHTAGSVVSMDLDINSASVNAFNVDLDVGTALSAAEQGIAYLATLNGKAADADTSGLFGTHLTLTGVSTSRADFIGHYVAIAGTRDTDDTDQGLLVGFGGTLNSSGATQYGVRVSCLDADHTHTDGTWYGLFVNNTSAVAAGSSYSLGLSQTLYSETTKAVNIATTTAIDTATLLSSFTVNQTMTGASAVNKAEAAQFVLTSNVEVGAWANALVAKIDFSTAGYVSGLAGVVCAELDMPGGAIPGGSGTYSVYEAEINCPTSYVGGAVPIHVFQINAWGAEVAQFDSSGYLFDLTGVSSGSGNIWYDHQMAAPAIEEFIRVKTPSGVRYLALYDANA